MRGAPGTTCTLRVVAAGPPWPDDLAEMVGDFLRTEPGSCYRIDSFRPAREGSATVGSFGCTRLDRDAVQLGDPGVWPLYWAPRTPAHR